ncbi:MAG TPA: hypothetical protein VGO52_22470 [Hyphomonadaceae bacterium]|nr:hypothetical protein [Hyphomonadaceae bacterium]
MTNKLKLGLLTTVATLALTACGGGGNGYGGGGYTPPVVVTLEDQVGAGSGFGALFRANANTDPTEPNANSVPALSLTTDPVAVP